MLWPAVTPHWAQAVSQCPMGWEGSSRNQSFPFPSHIGGGRRTLGTPASSIRRFRKYPNMKFMLTSLSLCKSCNFQRSNRQLQNIPPLRFLDSFSGCNQNNHFKDLHSILWHFTYLLLPLLISIYKNDETLQLCSSLYFQISVQTLNKGSMWNRHCLE